MMNKNAILTAGLLAIGAVAFAQPETPVPPLRPMQDLTLDEAVQTAVRQNPDIINAEQEIRRTRGVVMEVEAQAFPQITVGNSFTQTQKQLLLDGGPPSSGGSGSGGTSTSGSNSFINRGSSGLALFTKMNCSR